MTIALIDGDMIIYEACCRNETRVKFPDGDLVTADLEKSKRDAENALQDIAAAVGAEMFFVTLSDPKRAYFRKGLYPDYKENRTATPRPKYLGDVRAYIEDIHSEAVRWKPGLEADDVMGIMATKPALSKNNRLVVCSADKDMLQVPGLHYNHRRPSVGVITVDRRMATYWHLYQTLVGDSTDNYPGCPGVGPVKAKKALSQSPTWDTVLALYAKKNLGPEDALLQARLSRILTWELWDRKKQQPRLWAPENLT